MRRRPTTLILLGLPLFFTISLFLPWRQRLPQTDSLLKDPAAFSIPFPITASSDDQSPLLRPASSDYLDLTYQQRLPIVRFDPYPDYHGANWRKEWEGKFVPCMGPQGVDLSGEADDLFLLARATTPTAPNPRPMFGAFDETGLDDTHCFDRRGRLGLYGFRENLNATNVTVSDIEWEDVNWADLQQLCVERNQERFEGSGKPTLFKLPDHTEEVHKDNAKADDANKDDADTHDFDSDNFNSEDAYPDDAPSDGPHGDDTPDAAFSEDHSSDDAHSKDNNSDDAKFEDHSSDDTKLEDYGSDDAKFEDNTSDDAKFEDNASDEADSKNNNLDDADSKSDSPDEADSKKDNLEDANFKNDSPDDADPEAKSIDEADFKENVLGDANSEDSNSDYESSKEISLEDADSEDDTEHRLNRRTLPHLGSTDRAGSGKHLSRKAVLVRMSNPRAFGAEVIFHLRSMVAELSLHTGGEYSVYLLAEITDESLEIHKSEEAHRKALSEYIPKEFREMTILYNRELLEAWYPKVGYDGGPKLHSNQPVQIFSWLNPHFSHVWDIAIETRFTGNWYSFLAGSAEWARQQPRRLQWERAERFYIPSVHGTYANFSASIAKEYPHGGIWGPVPNEAVRISLGPEPPSITALEDDFVWGVGEDADDLVPSVLVNTANTPVFEYDKMRGFSEDVQHRALMVGPVKCLSKKLLHAMHHTQIGPGNDMRPELLAHSLALAHGLKVATFPLPVYYDNETSAAEVNEIFNTVHDPEKEFFLDKHKWSLPSKRFMTFWSKMNDGEDEEKHRHRRQQSSQSLYQRWYGVDEDGQRLVESRRSNLCLPGMLLHPVVI